jgi:hypothetical protein
LAGPREDVLSGAVRCGGISDDRAWLECYYGAAQPMRAQLALPPAPVSQTRLVPGGTVAVTPAPALAQSPGMPATAPPPRREKDSGFMGNLLGGQVLLNNVRASAYQFDKRGIFTITLGNGQVWQQEQGDSSFADWHEPASRYLITIRLGALGSANLKAQGDSKVYKVRRLR